LNFIELNDLLMPSYGLARLKEHQRRRYAAAMRQ